MARKHTKGWYYFENGVVGFYMGMTAHDKRVEERKNGKIIRFDPVY